MSKTMQSAHPKAIAEPRHISLLSQLGLVAAITALVGASCCALPLALAWLGLAGAWIAKLRIFVSYRPIITAAAVMLICMGWLIAIRRSAAKEASINNQVIWFVGSAARSCSSNRRETCAG